MSKVALEIEEENYESSIHLDRFSSFINTIQAEPARRTYQAPSNIF